MEDGLNFTMRKECFLISIRRCEVSTDYAEVGSKPSIARSPSDEMVHPRSLTFFLTWKPVSIEGTHLLA